MNNSIAPAKMTFSQKFFSKVLSFLGWTFDTQVPAIPKFIIVGATHTSNWDFVYFLLYIFAIGLKVSFIGKDTAFWWPMGIILKKLGGIPVNRRIRTNFVDQIIEKFNNSSQLRILITPEGTRHKTNYWKSGFYYIAHGAHIPILLGSIDYPRKKLELGPLIYTTGNIIEDFKIIQNYYADKIGKFPEEQGRIEIKPIS